MSARDARRAQALAAIDACATPGQHKLAFDATQCAISATCVYTPLNVPRTPALASAPGGFVDEHSRMRMSFVPGTALACALACTPGHGSDVCVLNFASARHPGGGYRTGANAQEESLARASALGVVLELNGAAQAVYAQNERDTRQCLYTTATIYSPHVPVLYNDDGTRLEQPAFCAFVSCAAPNAREAAKRGVPPSAVAAAIVERADLVVRTAVAHAHRNLVLGAHGTGVFGCDVPTVARAYRAALERHGNRHMHVAFAIPDARTMSEFQRAFLANNTT